MIRFPFNAYLATHPVSSIISKIIFSLFLVLFLDPVLKKSRAQLIFVYQKRCGKIIFPEPPSKLVKIVLLEHSLLQNLISNLRLFCKFSVREVTASTFGKCLHCDANERNLTPNNILLALFFFFGLGTALL